MSYSNIYYSPESYNLEVVAELEDPNASYSFDTVVVWKDTETGDLFWAADAGCSCPSPFEDFDRRNIHPLNYNTWNDLIEATSDRKGYFELEKFYNPADTSEFLRKVGYALTMREARI